MNFKAWNMKKGLKRVWILGSVLWFATPFFQLHPFFNEYYVGGPNLEIVLKAVIGAVYVGLWWALFYVGIWVIRGFVLLGLWVARGFKDDDDKQADF